MKPIPYVSDQYGPVAIAARQSVNALMIRGLIDYFSDHGQLVDVMRNKDPNGGTPFFFGLAETLLLTCNSSNHHIIHDTVYATYDSFALKRDLSIFLTENMIDATLFPKCFSEAHARIGAEYARIPHSFCIGLQHTNCYALGMTGYYHRHPIVRPRVNECFPLAEFAHQICVALGLLKKLHCEIYERICGACTFFVPIEVVHGRHCSFTADELPRIVFLSPSTDSMILACAIAHEFTHYELNSLDRYEPLVLTGFAGVRCYSPWRDEPRDALGLLHALYVFCEVAGLLAREVAVQENGGNDPRVVEPLERRLSLTRARLCQGLSELEEGHLTCIGQEMVRQMACFVDEIPVSSSLAQEMEQRVIKEKLDRVAHSGGHLS